VNQYLFYVGIGFAILLVCLVIPGLKIIAEAIFKGIIEFLTEVLKHKSTFIVWFVKTLFADHFLVVKHATTARDTIDPTQRIRRAAMGYDDDSFDD